MDRHQLISRSLSGCKKASTKTNLLQIADDGTNKVEFFIESLGQDLSILAFQGSNGMADWVQNGEFPQVQWQYGNDVVEFHKGFYEQALLAFLYIDANIGILDSKRLIVAGYSQGAAIAGIISLFLHRKYDVYPCLIACPRFTCSKGKKLFDAIHPDAVRLVNGTDLVTMLPLDLDIIGLDYEHVGNLVHVGNKNGTIPSLLDHRLDQYFKNYHAEAVNSKGELK